MLRCSHICRSFQLYFYLQYSSRYKLKQACVYITRKMMMHCCSGEKGRNSPMVFQKVKTAFPVLDPSEPHCLLQQLHQGGLENLPPTNTSKLERKYLAKKNQKEIRRAKKRQCQLRVIEPFSVESDKLLYNHPQITEQADGHTIGSLFLRHHLMQNQSSLQSQEKGKI